MWHRLTALTWKLRKWLIIATVADAVVLVSYVWAEWPSHGQKWPPGAAKVLVVLFLIGAAMVSLIRAIEEVYHDSMDNAFTTDLIFGHIPGVSKRQAEKMAARKNAITRRRGR